LTVIRVVIGYGAPEEQRRILWNAFIVEPKHHQHIKDVPIAVLNYQPHRHPRRLLIIFIQHTLVIRTM